MRKPHREMTLLQLESAIASYEARIASLTAPENQFDQDKRKLAASYKTKHKDATKWHTIRLEAIQGKNAKTFKSEEKEFKERLQVLFNKPFDNNFFQQFTNDLRRHLQNRII